MVGVEGAEVFGFGSGGEEFDDEGGGDFFVLVDVAAARVLVFIQSGYAEDEEPVGAFEPFGVLGVVVEVEVGGVEDLVG